MALTNKYLREMRPILDQAIGHIDAPHIGMLIKFHKQMHPDDQSSEFWKDLHSLELKIYYSGIADYDPDRPYRYKIGDQTYVRYGPYFSAGAKMTEAIKEWTKPVDETKKSTIK